MRSHPRTRTRGRARWLGTAAAALTLGGALAIPGVAVADGGVVGGSDLGQSGVVVDTAPGLPALPPTTATSFVVADADTGDVLAALNAHEKLAPASTLKTLTAVTLLPRLSPSTALAAQSDAPSADGTKAGIVAGTAYKVDDLFTAMLMMSANDAAVALADANGGLAPTLQEMNAEAAHLQADDTRALTPNGLDAPGQSSSAYDLALIFRAGLGDSRFRHYLALRRAAFPAPGGKSFQIQTHDRLLAGYPGMVGGKNGYTIAAQASYVGAATRDGHTIIVSVMRDQPNFWDEVKALLDWGFAADGVVAPIGHLVGPAVPTSAPSADAAGVRAAPTTGAAPGSSHLSASAQRSRSDLGSTIGAVLTWLAVGVGAAVFLIACARLLLRRRSRGNRDRYLANLSRLSGSVTVPDQPGPPRGRSTLVTNLPLDDHDV